MVCTRNESDTVVHMTGQSNHRFTLLVAADDDTVFDDKPVYHTNITFSPTLRMHASLTVCS